MRDWRSLAAAGAALAALQACGGGASDGIRLEDWSPRRYEIDCERAIRCGVVSSRDGCPGFLPRSYEVEPDQLASDIKAGLLKYDARAAAECLAEVADAATYGSCLYTVFSPLGFNAACERMLTGTVAGGGACTSPWQCASRICNQACNRAECCAGTCLERPIVPLGGDCTIADGRLCAVGTGCVGGVCVALSGQGKVGDLCATPEDCEVGAVCLGTTCGTLPAEGAQCTGGLCDQMADYCDTTVTQTCVPRRRIGQSCPGGESCTLDAYCDAATSKCVPRKAAGAACSRAEECTWLNSQCNDAAMTCKPPPMQPLATCPPP